MLLHIVYVYELKFYQQTQKRTLFLCSTSSYACETERKKVKKKKETEKSENISHFLAAIAKMERNCFFFFKILLK